jgi:hypothetical protein
VPDSSEYPLPQRPNYPVLFQPPPLMRQVKYVAGVGRDKSGLSQSGQCKGVGVKYSRPGRASRGWRRKEYSRLMHKKPEGHRQQLIAQRRAHGLGLPGRSALLRKRPASRPKSTKISTITDPRPRVLSAEPSRRGIVLAWYFRMYLAFKAASVLYRAGDLTAQFPRGMYRPYLSTSIPQAP